MGYEQIAYDVADGIATCTLQRPEHLNAYTPRMGVELRDSMYQAAGDSSVRAIVLTGAGRGFCAGADMKLLSAFSGAGGATAGAVGEMPAVEHAPPPGPIRPDFQTEFSYLLSIPKPIIAAVNGPAAGVGFVLALFSDIRLAGEKARMGAIFSRRGLVAEYGISWILPRLVGLANASDILFSGRLVDAAEALRMGLVSRVIPQSCFAQEVHAYARDLVALSSPRSIRVMKRQLYDDQLCGLAASVDVATREMHESLGSEDFREGVAHFLEKRPPRFPGR
ncbi:MAG: enoyl-CoA hydratase/isomerase family protein [Deltaproteobacteria bacterium]|nr:enoyl-CoA hydratase/isomerase family protein [Deltaproteobacteria bacterium]